MIDNDFFVCIMYIPPFSSIYKISFDMCTQIQFFLPFYDFFKKKMIHLKKNKPFW